MSDLAEVVSIQSWRRGGSTGLVPDNRRWVLRGRCPACGDRVRLRLSRGRGLVERRLLLLLGRTPYRCNDCGRRFLRRRAAVAGAWESVRDESLYDGFLRCEEGLDDGELLNSLAVAEREMEARRQAHQAPPLRKRRKVVL